MDRYLEERLGADVLSDFCRRNHIRRLSLFGSTVSGRSRKGSDIDILVEFQEGRVPGYLGMSRLQGELQDLLGMKVDLRTPAELSRYFRDDVLREAEVQYAT